MIASTDFRSKCRQPRNATLLKCIFAVTDMITFFIQTVSDLNRTFSMQQRGRAFSIMSLFNPEIHQFTFFFSPESFHCSIFTIISFLLSPPTTVSLCFVYCSGPGGAPEEPRARRRAGVQCRREWGDARGEDFRSRDGCGAEDWASLWWRLCRQLCERLKHISTYLQLTVAGTMWIW